MMEETKSGVRGRGKSGKAGWNGYDRQNDGQTLPPLATQYRDSI